MLKLKFQYFGHLMQTDSLEKTLMLGKIEGRRRRVDRGWDGWMASPTRWTWVWVDSRRWRWTGRPSVLQSMGSQRAGHDWATELNWTESLEVEIPGLVSPSSCVIKDPWFSDFCCTAVLSNPQHISDSFFICLEMTADAQNNHVPGALGKVVGKCSFYSQHSFIKEATASETRDRIPLTSLWPKLCHISASTPIASKTKWIITTGLDQSEGIYHSWGPGLPGKNRKLIARNIGKWYLGR